MSGHPENRNTSERRDRSMLYAARGGASVELLAAEWEISPATVRAGIKRAANTEAIIEAIALAGLAGLGIIENLEDIVVRRRGQIDQPITLPKPPQFGSSSGFSPEYSTDK